MDDRITPHPRVGWRSIGSDVVAYNCESHTVVLWNDTASFLWRTICQQAPTLGDLVASLVEEYDVQHSVARSDVEEFIRTIARDGFLAHAAPSLHLPPTDVSGGDVLLDVERAAIEQRVPYAVLLETTFACNERCVHCYMEECGPQMELAQIAELLDELARAGTLFLTLTGGEFLVRSDALDIIEAAARRGFVLDVLTNATRVSASVATVFGRLPVRRVQVSLYGSDSERHDAVTRRPGSFHQTVRGIELLRGAGVKVECAMTVLRTNVDDVEATESLAGHLGCGFLANHIVTGRNSGSLDTHSLRLTDEQLRAYLHEPRVAARYRGRKPFAEHQHYIGVTDLLDAAPCYSGFNTCAIRPNGDVLPCNQLQYVVGNVLRQPFGAIWRTSPRLERLRAITVRDLPTCSACTLLPYCTRCPGLALLEGGDLRGPSPEHCRITPITASIGEQEV